jgi:hypothetical protein
VIVDVIELTQNKMTVRQKIDNTKEYYQCDLFGFEVFV